MLIGTYVAQYIYESMCGFVKGHIYNIEIDKIGMVIQLQE